jgi:GNAT superfamily N-acetyltransferase
MSPLAPTIAVRAATVDDADAIARLFDGLRAHLGDPQGAMSADVIRRDGFGPQKEFDVMLAMRDGVPVGYALYYEAYEPAYAARGLYLADLFVAAEARGLGAGRALIDALAGEARRRSRMFVWWLSQPANETALGFYRALNLDVIAPTVSHVRILKD